MIDFDPKEARGWDQFPDELSTRQIELGKKRNDIGLTGDENYEYMKIGAAARAFSQGVADRAQAKADAFFMAKSLDEKLLMIYQRILGLEKP